MAKDTEQGCSNIPPEILYKQLNVEKLYFDCSHK